MITAMTSRAKLMVLVVALVGCNDSDDNMRDRECSLLVINNRPVGFEFACAPAQVPGVVLSGVCFVGDAGPPAYNPIRYGENGVAVSSLNPGLCNVELTFDTGFVFSEDVTFVLRGQSNGCGDYTYTAPTQGTFVVNNPDSTCVDAGL